MARRNESILDVLERFPWWVSVALSGISYVTLKYLVPLLEFHKEGPLDVKYSAYKGFADAAHAMALPIALILLVPAPFSAINSWRKRKRTPRQGDGG